MDQPERKKKELPKLPTVPSPTPSPKFGRAPLSPKFRGTERWQVFSGQAIAIHKFDFEEDNRLPLYPGDRIAILEKGFGWYKGRNLDTDCFGIFPCNYVHLLPDGYKEDDTQVTPHDPVVLQAAQCIREWGSLMLRSWKENRFQRARAIMTHIQTLIRCRTDMLNVKTKSDDRKMARKKIRFTVAKCTVDLGLPLTVKRADGVFADAENTEVMDLYRMYREVDTQYKPSGGGSGNNNSNSSNSTASNSVAQMAEQKKTFVQVFLKFNAFVCKVDEENDSSVELLFSLFSVQKKKDITEAYVVKLTNKLMVQNLEKIDLQKTIFANVELSDTVLVCRVIRVGKLAGRQKATARYRIPFGVAMVPVSSVQQEKNSRIEHQLPIYMQQGLGFQALLDKIIRNPKEGLAAGGGVAVEVKVYNTPDLESLRDEVKDFDVISMTNMLEMESTNLKPGAVRNDLYLCLERGEVQQEGKKTAKNVEVSMTIRTYEGHIVPGCLTTGSGEPLFEEFRTCVFYHDNNPIWTEYVRINMNPDLFPMSHVLFEVRHCTTKDEKKGKLFGIGFMPLVSSDGTIIDNSTRQITLYKPNPKPKDPCYYLKPESAGLKTSKEYLWITPQLASTKMLQNPSLHKLLNWEKHDQELMELLKAFTFVDRIDLVKVIGDLFPALFSMMEGRSDLRMFIFEAISYLLSLLVAGRFDAFAPIVDQYFDEQFKNPNSYHHVLSCLTKYFGTINASSKQPAGSGSLNALKGLPYWIKIVCKSKGLEVGTPDPSQFARELDMLFNQVCTLLRSKERSDLGAQMLALKAFDDLLLANIEPFFSDDALSKLLMKVLASVEFDDVRPTLNSEKLEFIKKVLSTSALKHRNPVRQALVPAALGAVQSHMSKTANDAPKCLEIICSLLSIIQDMMKQDDTAPMPFAAECAQFIPLVITALHDVQVATDHAKLAFLMLFYLLPRDAVHAYYNNTVPRQKVKDSLIMVLKTEVALLKHSLPKNWFSLYMFQSKSVVKTLQVIRPLLVARIQSFPKEIPLWTVFFELIFALLTQPLLQLENITDSKRQLIVRRYGDLRIEAAMILRRTWNELKMLQSIFVPKFVSHFLSLIMLRQSDVREIGVDMYWAVLLREIQETGTYKTVGAATIDNVDVLSSQDDDAPVDYKEFETFFLSSLKERMDQADTNAKNACESFYADLSSLLGLLRELKTLPEGAEYEEERILATMQLMAYLRKTDRKATYIRYVQQLSDMLSDSGNFSEAALTLLLYAGQLEWKTGLVEAAGSHPEESESSRKERMYLRAIDLFCNGKQWERAITLIKELCTRYETVTYQYDRLAQLLQRQSTLFSQILTAPRFYPNYFRVGFYGNGFNSTVRNKQFIYKGLELESLTDFTARLQLVYRKAEILKTTSITPEIENGEGQFLLVTSVNVSSSEEFRGVKREFDSNMPPPVQKYLEANDVNHFFYAKPFKGESVASGDLDPQTKEFSSLWVRKFFMITAETFPSYRKRLLVTETKEIDISPIQNAVSDIESKNAALLSLVAQAQKDPQQLSPLSMMLNGIIDAAVNGGTKIYTQLFLSPQYASNRPKDAEMCKRLRTLLVDQVGHVASGLRVHRQICPEALLGLQQKMEEFFVALEKQMVPYGYVIPERKLTSTRGGDDDVERSSGAASTTPATSTATSSSAASSSPSSSANNNPSVPDKPLPKSPTPLRPTAGTTTLTPSPRGGTIMSGSHSPRQGATTGSHSPRQGTMYTSPPVSGPVAGLSRQKSSGALGTAAPSQPAPTPPTEQAPELQKKKSFGTIRKKE